ncbi:HNH endonuclease [Chroococcidiopsis cubana]|uniref:HNH endonuclease n=1 Tax=Chroococcidiopsis cubana TaxID=171392 RepID=UPI002ACE75CB|nr:HNH endonuclease [Chroococcidiopsis cubana]
MESYYNVRLGGLQVDHIYGDKLDNRLENLRPATNAQNQANSKTRGNKSGFRGVCWDKTNKKWVAKIKVNGKTKHLGRFSIAEDAACAFNKAALEYHGEYAHLNKVLCNFDNVSA